MFHLKYPLFCLFDSAGLAPLPSRQYSIRYSDWLRAGRSGEQIPVGVEIFRTCPDRPWCPPSLLYNGYRVFPRGPHPTCIVADSGIISHVASSELEILTVSCVSIAVCLTPWRLRSRAVYIEQRAVDFMLGCLALWTSIVKR